MARFTKRQATPALVSTKDEHVDRPTVSRMDFDVVVVRTNMLCEVYGAGLLGVEREVEVVETSAQTELTPQQLDAIRGKRVLIAGGYYRSAMNPILEAAKSVVVFLNSSDKLEAHPNLAVVRASSSGSPGFASFCLSLLDPTLQAAPFFEPASRMARYLDEYLYGNPSDEALCFQNGVYQIDMPTDAQKIASLATQEDIDRCILAGVPKRRANLRIAEQRLKAAVDFAFLFQGRKVNVVAGIGDSPIVDTCLLFASQADLGVLFRYDVKQKKTFISAIANQHSGLDAGGLMATLFGGGGSHLMGGASVKGLHVELESFLKDAVAAASRANTDFALVSTNE